MDDLISRQDAINIVEGIDSHFVKYIEQLPSAVKPIGYLDCSNALLKMWTENVLTDGEYYRIHEKLDASNLAKGEIR